MRLKSDAASRACDPRQGRDEVSNTTLLVLVAAIQGIGWLANLVISGRFKRAMDTAVGKALDEQRHQTERALEDVRLERERASQDFGLFAAKRNTVYAEVYALFVQLDGRLQWAVGIGYGTDFARSDRDDILRYLREQVKLSEQRITAILELWDRDRSAGASQLSGIDRRHRSRLIQRAFGDAKNAVALNELYFSTEARATVQRLVIALAPVVSGLTFDDDERPRRKAFHDSIEQIEPRLIELKQVMQDEMRRGFGPLRDVGALP
jgi:hypothetical protein